MRPTRIPLVSCAVLSLVLAVPPVHADVLPTKKAALVFIPSQLELAASPQRVWAAVCSVKGFSTLTGFVPEPADAGRTFSRLGDSARASIWSDKGRLVVTAFIPLKEIRVTWEPENASYLCAKRILLAKTAAGTKLTVWDRYSDDQPTVAETAKTVAAETAKAEEAFRRLVEAK